MLFCYLLGDPTHFCSHIKKLWKMCTYDWALQNASWDCHDYFHARKRGSVISLWESQIFDIVGWLSNRRGRFMHFWLQAPNLAQMFLGSPWTDFEGVPRNRAFSRGGEEWFCQSTIISCCRFTWYSVIGFTTDRTHYQTFLAHQPT